MVKVSYNVSICEDLERISATNSVLITSDLENDESFDVITKIITEIFMRKSFVFKAVGLPENIEEVMLDIESYDIHYYKGDSDKFFIRKYPECVATIDENQISKILKDCWSNAIYEGRRIYILNREYQENLISVLDQYVYADSDSLKESWRFLDAVIENVPESKENAFVLVFKESFFTSISSLINGMSQVNHI